MSGLPLDGEDGIRNRHSLAIAPDGGPDSILIVEIGPGKRTSCDPTPQGIAAALLQHGKVIEYHTEISVHAYEFSRYMSGSDKGARYMEEMERQARRGWSIAVDRSIPVMVSSEGDGKVLFKADAIVISAVDLHALLKQAATLGQQTGDALAKSEAEVTRLTRILTGVRNMALEGK